jgi:multiple sugar transport system ATP-binding protein
VGIRPEDLVVAKDGKGLSVKIDVVEELGADGYLYGHVDVDGAQHSIVIRVDGRKHPVAGDTVVVAPAPKHIHVFDGESGTIEVVVGRF